MASTQASVDVNVPVTTAYSAWTQYERYPQFMEGVEEVRKTGERMLHWRVSIDGQDEEYDAEVLNETPDQRVAWRSVAGKPNAGFVEFEPIDTMRTRINLRIDYEPEGMVEKVGEMMGTVSRRAEGDLQRFKDMVERRAAA